MTQAQIIEEYIGLFSSLNVAYFVIIIYYLGEKAGEYYDKNRKKIWNEYWPKFKLWLNETELGMEISGKK